MSLVQVDGNRAFDMQPLTMFEGFILRARCVEVVGRPTLEQWARPMSFSVATEDGSPYWIADLLSYAATREDWKDRIEQVCEMTGLSRKRVMNISSALSKVEIHERDLAPSPSHAEEVARLPRQEQTELLEKARDEGWSRSELRRNIHATRRTKVLDHQAPLEGMFSVIYAAPAWREPQAIPQLCALPIQSHTAANATLFLWVPSSHLLKNPGPRDVIEAWGFHQTSSIVWDKVYGIEGRFFNLRHEFLLVCERGDGRPEVPTPAPDSLFAYRWEQDRIGKPVEFRQLIEKLYPTARKVELFANAKAEGWTSLGSDPKKWAQEASQ